MNTELHRLARGADLEAQAQAPLRLRFGLACVRRVRHLLESPEAIEGLDTLEAFLDGRVSPEALAQAVQQMAVVAGSHPGSRSLDGAAHAAVSATYAVSQAVAGRALQAAAYAAYATVYAYGGYAVTDPEAFAEEFAWQVSAFRALSEDGSGLAAPAG
ncbi:hypothetical protein GFK26_10490 [Variovorax paradoxus]|uniref:Uncharacterized protein n=1 Tax=Variovorax paradoxus TaxID=34073 RepID=A0A5Q0M0D1_VARPD|nr:hypothetical protein [Variovorax paradoxus]QFZ83160.1 hypothetical protein GFK26_10490 [Variovorax paradoxus]